MNLPDHLRQRLTEEYVAAVEGMRKSADPAKKLFFFSIFFGEASRVLNQSWDPELALVHLVTQAANGQVFARLEQIRRGDNNAVLPAEFFTSLENEGEKIAEYVRSGKKPPSVLYSSLEKIAELTYLTTGNGYYLYLRGKYTL